MPRLPEEAPPVAQPIAPTLPEPQTAALSLSHSQPSRTEESLRPVEQQPLVEPPPEASKVPLHVPKSSCMLESLPMNHISTPLTGGISRLSRNLATWFQLQRNACLFYVGFFFFFLSCRRSIGFSTFAAATTAKAHGGSQGSSKPVAVPYEHVGTY